MVKNTKQRKLLNFNFYQKTKVYSERIIYILLGILLVGCTAEDKVGYNADIPILKSLSSTIGVSGDILLIHGSHFGNDKSNVEVLFNNIQANVVSITNELITTNVPSNLSTSNIFVQVIRSGQASNKLQFLLDYRTPKISSLSLNKASSGAEIVINGEGFGDQIKDVVVQFAEETATVVTVAETAIKVIVPQNKGSRLVEMKVKVKQKTSNTIEFTYLDLTYNNPVSNLSLPDPTIIKSTDGMFYLYATEDIGNIPIMRSSDLINWTLYGTAFSNETRPTFEPNGGLWAPDINYINGQYVMYYSMAVWGNEWTCGIGVAVADKPTGPFIDKGKLFRSNEINVRNSIDPAFVEDNGKKYLVWGSFRGIYGVELDNDGLSLKTGSEIKQIAGTAFEGVYIHKRDGYYYMFASIGGCCNGLNSTYQLVVGRSTSLFGPYFNKSGTNMMNNGYSLVISKNSSFVGNGHCSQIISDDAGQDWILYHGFRTDNPTGRVLLLDQIIWNDEGWPTIATGTPSISASAPYFN